MSKSPPHFTIQPQRRLPGQGFRTCAAHAAQRFAVVEVRGSAGRFHSKVIVAFSTFAEANAAMLGLSRKHSRGKRLPQPGSRWSDDLAGLPTNTRNPNLPSE